MKAGLGSTARGRPFRKALRDFVSGLVAALIVLSLAAVAPRVGEAGNVAGSEPATAEAHMVAVEALSGSIATGHPRAPGGLGPARLVEAPVNRYMNKGNKSNVNAKSAERPEGPLARRNGGLRPLEAGSALQERRAAAGHRRKQPLVGVGAVLGDGRLGLMLVAFVFAAMCALTLTFWRHLNGLHVRGDRRLAKAPVPTGKKPEKEPTWEI